MILKALDTLHISSVSSNNILAGQSFELDDAPIVAFDVRGQIIERPLEIGEFGLRLAVFALPGAVLGFKGGECLTRGFKLLARRKLAWVQARQFRRELLKALTTLEYAVIALWCRRTLP